MPLHLQPAWLDAVCGTEHWDICLAYDASQAIVGVLPYYRIRRLGISQITMPPLTDYMGPWIQLPEDDVMKRERRYTLHQRILQELVDQLPEVDYFQQQYYPHLANWLPFYWRGYRQTTLYTYTFDDLTDPDLIYRQFKRTVRTDLKKAEQQVTIQHSDDLGGLIRLYEASLQRQGKQPAKADLATLERLYPVLRENDQARILVAIDQGSGAPHAALLLVWDQECTYFLLSGADPAYKNSSAVHLLYWSALQESGQQGRSADFCGSMLPGVEHVLRAYGARRQPHYRIYRARNRWFRLLAVALGKDY